MSFSLSKKSIARHGKRKREWNDTSLHIRQKAKTSSSKKTSIVQATPIQCLNASNFYLNLKSLNSTHSNSIDSPVLPSSQQAFENEMKLNLDSKYTQSKPHRLRNQDSSAQFVQAKSPVSSKGNQNVPQKDPNQSNNPSLKINKINSQDPSIKFLSNPESAPVVKSSIEFFRDLFPSYVTHLGPKLGWRGVAARGTESDPIAKIGIFEEGTNNVVPVRSSPVHHDSINISYLIIEEAIKRSKITGYQNDTGKGILKYLNMTVESQSSQVQLTVVVNASSFEDASPMLTNFLKAIQSNSINKDLWCSIWINYNKTIKHSSRILSSEKENWELYFGKKETTEQFRSYQVGPDTISPVLYFPPQVFHQANLEGFVKIIDRIRDWVPDHSNVLELYGGVGTIGLHLLDKISKLTCSDVNVFNYQCFLQSIEKFPPSLKSKIDYEPFIQFIRSAVEIIQANKLKDRNLCIVDPARKGLDKEVVAAFLKPNLDLRRIIYVSCGFPALQNNIQALIRPINKKPRWKIVFAEGHLLFPGSNHIENLVILDSNC